MKIGFTGRRGALDYPQFSALNRELAALRFSGNEFHHGDCLGADSAAHVIAASLGLRTVVHPPKNPKFRAFMKADETLPEGEYLDRNKDIVRATDILIACPDGEERLRSGTWSTVRFARVLGRPITIIYPNGRVVKENP